MTHEQKGIYRIFKTQILSDLVLEWFFNEYDVYYNSNCNHEFLIKDSGYNSIDGLRRAWVFGNSGYISQLDRYYNFYDRLIEYATVKDNPNTLRQKLNILHLMNECNFEPNNPIHITLYDVKNNNKVLDMDDEKTWKDFYIIVHPGHTRVLASVFMKRNILSNLIYVKKKWGIDIKGKNVQKIDSTKVKSLFFDRFGNNEQKTNEYKIFCWWYGDDVKIEDLAKSSHEENGDVFKVLKLYDYFDIKNNKLFNKSIGQSYIYNTFWYSNQYFKILFNNELNIYGVIKTSEIYNLFNQNLMKLYHDDSTNFVDLKNVYIDFINGNLFKAEAMISGIERNKDLFDDDEKYIFEEFKKLFKNISVKKKIQNDYHSFMFKKGNYYEVEKNNDTFNNIAIKNNYKGFAVFVDTSKIKKFNRTLPEILYLANPTVSIVRAEDNQFAIINCEHEYWKTNENYQEIIIQKSFYEN